jgi:hypothetical protein
MYRRSVALPLVALVASILSASCGSTTETFVNSTSPSSARCQPTLGAPSASYGPAGGTGSLTVAIERECEWSADPSASWIVVTSGKQGQGEGTVAYRVMENADPVSRRGAIAVSGQSVQIAQDAAPCQFSVSPLALTAPASGGDLAITVRAHAACSWTAASSASWVTVSNASGKGDGAVQVHVAGNTSGARTADLTVAGQRITVAQDARAQEPPPPPPPAPGPEPPSPNPPPPSPPQCSYELSTDSASFDAQGGTGTVRVRTSTGCPWAVVSSAGWITVAGASTGTGAAEIVYVVAPNFSTSGRSATLTIQSEVLRVSQARAEELKLDGRISNVSGSCPNIRFQVDGRTVTTDRTTDFRRGDCSDARTGKDVTVRGFPQPDGTVRATRVEF